jgi:galactofuranosylgalactofuranosylrhamnosyl-N-acetylglucosaminyl-diphospho-decaprenol beta-1,5/1,6-galactofuranosyltransferase
VTGAAPEGSAPVVLQTLLLPDPDLLSDPSLFLRLEGGARTQGSTVWLPPGGRLVADGWMNLFPRGLWGRAAHLRGLALEVAGQGAVKVTLDGLCGSPGRDGRRAPPTGLAPPVAAPLGTWDLVLDGVPRRIALDGLPPAQGAAGLTVLTLAAGPGGARIDALAWAADPGPRPPLRLAIAITTFRREAALAATAARVSAFLEAAPGGDLAGAHLFVIDNAGTAAPAPHPRLTLIPGRNLGGAGGFARALAAARAGGFDHCLFMDDDATFPMENLVRTSAFLRLARGDRAAVAGAMISAARPGAIWEYGAVFDRFCRPLFNGTDLTDRGQAAAMEEAAALPKPPGFYGGFWFFAFPVAAVRHDPFPFFVRGDDIGFSLANRFDTVTLPGVVSLQDDFGHKESPQTLYLDLRNHLHHHLVQAGMEIGRWRTVGIAWRFILRSLVRMHYASAAAQCLAWADVMEGPGHFETHADMGLRRAEIAALAAPEDWGPLTAPGTVPPYPRAPSRVWARLMQATLNGHLVPFWGLIGARRQIPIAARALTWPLWGAAEARFVDVAGGRAYAVTHDKARAAAILGHALRLTWAWVRGYRRLAATYRTAYGPMTAPAAWAARFEGRQP